VRPGADKKARRLRVGFTLVEVIVVLVILAILAAIAIPALTGYIVGGKLFLPQFGREFFLRFGRENFS
jgi:prepilin-type N-terminal cleavage/methylation domain-containing protein